MTPKQKANEILDTFDGLEGILDWETIMKCALITINEILKSNPTKINCDSSELNYGYYQEVKKEIENYGKK
jgi:hypothetical protein